MLAVVKADVAAAKTFNFYSHYIDYIFYIVDKSIQQEVKGLTAAQVDDIDYLISKLQEGLSE